MRVSSTARSRGRARRRAAPVPEEGARLPVDSERASSVDDRTKVSSRPVLAKLADPSHDDRVAALHFLRREHWAQGPFEPAPRRRALPPPTRRRSSWLLSSDSTSLRAPSQALAGRRPLVRALGCAPVDPPRSGSWSASNTEKSSPAHRAHPRICPCRSSARALEALGGRRPSQGEQSRAR